MATSLTLCLDLFGASPAGRRLAGLAFLAAAAAPSAGAEEGKAGDWAADLEDVRRCLGGDGEAFRAIVERHQRRVGAILWRFSRDPQTHEELAQDVFVEAFLSLRAYRAQAPLAHWLARIATRVGYRHWKRQARERERAELPIEEWDGASRAAPGQMAPGEAAELLYRLLAQLPPRDRLALTLRFVEERTVAQTAQLTGWSQTMVKVQTWRARKKLKRLFEQAAREAER